MGEQLKHHQLDVGIDLDHDRSRKAEKEKLFQMQQKRLQQMSLSKLSKDSISAGSRSADSMINDILQNSQNMRLEVNSNPSKFKVRHHNFTHQNGSSLSTIANNSLLSQPMTSGDHNSNKHFNSEGVNVLNQNVKISPAKENHPSLNYPIWCPSSSSNFDQSSLPSIYSQVWNLVKLDNKSNLCDTTRLYPILLSSQLSTNLLANIWSQVNQTVPGQLTFQELMLSLALVGLHQHQLGSAFNLSHLLEMKTAPIPNLQLPNQPSPVLTLSNSTHSSLIESTSTNKIVETSSSSQEINESDNFDEDFADFQSVQQSEDRNEAVDNWCSFGEASYSDSSKDTDEPEKLPSETSPETAPVIQLTYDFVMPSQQKTKETIKKILSDEQKDLTRMVGSLLLTHTSEEVSSKPEDSLNEDKNKAIINTTNSVDRYQAFKDLFKEVAQKSDDEFGEFKSHSKSEDITLSNTDKGVEKNEMIKIWIKVLKCIKQLVHKVFNVLIVNHDEERAIEALSTEEGTQYIFDLVELYHISQRIFNYYLQNVTPNHLITELVDDINLTCKTLKKLFSKVSKDINFEEDQITSSSASNLINLCTICYSYSDDGILLSGNSYHSSCANLWLNCIEPTLPVSIVKMKY